MEPPPKPSLLGSHLPAFLLLLILFWGLCFALGRSAYWYVMSYIAAAAIVFKCWGLTRDPFVLVVLGLPLALFALVFTWIVATS
jgi:hypothetical protein